MARAAETREKIQRYTKVSKFLASYPCLWCGGSFLPVAIFLDRTQSVAIRLLFSLYVCEWNEKNKTKKNNNTILTLPNKMH